EAEELGSGGAGEPGRGGEGRTVTSALPHDRSPARPHAIPLPPLDLLHDGEEVVINPDDATRQAAIIEETLAAFNIPAQVIEINQGPTVTQFGVRPGYIERKFSDGTVRRRKVKVSRITGLSDDLALALAARSIRVEAPVPGRPYIGIEIPNGDASMVTLKGILTSREFHKLRAALPVALGRDVSGRPVAVDLSRMPHLLIAGATGSGKSVCINTIVATLLFNLGPEELRLLMVDPKMVELIPYNGVPHLIAPVVTEVERVVGALTWAMNEMDRRYKRFSEIGVRNLSGYNAWAVAHDEETLPYIVIIIDELADLMMMAPDQVERIICRLAQMARATGMHLILATQRPSVDVVTGLIKANFPARIAFAVTSGIDSRVILDTPGAESLLGRGDMLFMAPESSKLQRLQGCFVSDQEINALTDYWRLALPPATNPEEEANTPWDAIVAQQSLEAEDELLPQAMELIRQAHWASTSFLQRKLRIGYSRAARLMDLLEARGLISPTDPENPARSREVYMAEDEDEDDLDGGESERDGRS
ncbi:MAG TPA: DNA translocase FtsK, partial [Ardenticatenaceae bacterium]|nr:DNA translocase FtsK [Ardenticatenaceae bacterium]